MIIKYNSLSQIVRPLVNDGKLSGHAIFDWFLMSIFIFPPYFGVDLGIFDLTASRLFLIMSLYIIWNSPFCKHNFLSVLKMKNMLLGMFFFWGVCVVDNVYRRSFGGIFQVLVDTLLGFWLLVYLFLFEYDLGDVIRKIQAYSFFLGVMGFIEVIIKKSPFSYLNTLHYGQETAERLGLIRICGPCTTSNGYGLLLLMLIPLACIDYDNNRISIMKNKLLILILACNVFFSGTRLALGVMFLELIVIIRFVEAKERKTTLFFAMLFVFVFGLMLIVLKNTSFAQSILRALFQVVDTVLGTTYANAYGSSSEQLARSNYYRQLLLQVFKLDYLNPIMGRGSTYSFSYVIEGYWLRSVDNYYVHIYIMYAYPGLVLFLLMTLQMLRYMLQGIKRYDSAIVKGCFIATISYYIGLWYLDQLQTYKIMYVIFAVVVCFLFRNKMQGLEVIE